MKEILFEEEFLENVITDEVITMFENGETLQIKPIRELKEVEAIVIESLNLLLSQREFVKINNLITKQYSLRKYIRELSWFYESYLTVGFNFDKVLESETLNGVYFRAYFSNKYVDDRDIKDYDLNNNQLYGLDYNYDIRVVRRASMRFILDIIVNKAYKDVNLRNLCIWDFKFGLA
jgi:hypothetical protein